MPEDKPRETDWGKLAHLRLERAHREAREGRSSMFTKFDDTCVDCRQHIVAGTKVYYAKGKGAVCLPCQEKRRQRVDEEWCVSEAVANAARRP